MTGDGAGQYKMVRLRKETYEDLRALMEAANRLGVAGLPDGIRMRVESMSDAVDMGVRAARKAGVL